MMSEEQITQRLEQLGQKTGEIRATMRDVAKLIVARAVVAYVQLLPETERETLSRLSNEEADAYLAEHRDSLPQMSQETFDKIHDETWNEFFEHLGS